MIYTKNVLYLGFLLLVLSFSVIANVESNALDGKVFVGVTGVQGDEKGAVENDEVGFREGEFFSNGCAEWGFEASEYLTEKTGDDIHFSSILLSDDHGKIVWEGTVQGDNIEANFTWTKERWWWFDAHEVKWFKGKLKK